jgi:hypothetical protein
MSRQNLSTVSFLRNPTVVRHSIRFYCSGFRTLRLSFSLWELKLWQPEVHTSTVNQIQQHTKGKKDTKVQRTKGMWCWLMPHARISSSGPCASLITATERPTWLPAVPSSSVGQRTAYPETFSHIFSETVPETRLTPFKIDPTQHSRLYYNVIQYFKPCFSDASPRKIFTGPKNFVTKCIFLLKTVDKRWFQGHKNYRVRKNKNCTNYIQILKFLFLCIFGITFMYMSLNIILMRISVVFSHKTSEWKIISLKSYSVYFRI